MQGCSGGRKALLLLLIIGCLLSFARAWAVEDHEIFRLKDELELHDNGKTFYEFMGIKPNAGQDDLNKAYRKLSRSLHPDKARSSWIAAYNKPPTKKSSSPGSKPTVHVRKDKKPSNSEITRFNKQASARFERLSLIANILRGESRKRYDHFLNNGFPAWRGTGYYYARYRPGLGMVLTGLFVFLGGGVHYGALYLGWKRQREFVERYIKHARRMAWGDDSALGAIPGLGGAGQRLGTAPVADQTNSGSGPPTDSEESMQWNRRQKRAMEKEKKKEGKNGGATTKNARVAEKARKEGISTPVEAELISGPVGAKKRTVAENGKVLIVDSVGNVFLEEETEEGEVHEFLLDPDEVPAPTLRSTFLVRGPLFLYNVSIGRLLNKQTADYVARELAEGDDGAEAETVEEAALHAAVPVNANQEARRRKLK